MKIKAENLIMRYGRDPKVLDDVSFVIETGEITALVGRNGSGKTTILQILTQILDPISGTITLDDEDLKSHPDLKSNIAYLPDSFDFFAYDSGYSAMDYYQMIYPNFDRDFVIREAKVLSLDLKKSIRKQSKGNKTLLGLIMVLGTNAPFLLLDEVLDGIDVLNKSKIIGYILDAVEEKRGVLISSHQLAELQGITDNVLYLSLEGRISESTNEGNKEIQKYQIVSNASLSDEILDSVLIRQHLGRVYIVLADGTTNIEELLNDPTVVQFDKLPVLLEDLFYWEDRYEQHIQNN